MRRGEPGSESATRAGGQVGTITHLIVQQQPTRVAVFLDGVFGFEVSQDLVRVWGLRVGRQLSVEEQAHLAAEEQLLAAQAIALQYLATRPRTAHEVQQKLRQRGVVDEVVAQVMERLHARGALNDAAYAHAYLTTRLATRGHGPQRLRHDLRRRGIHREDIEEALQQGLTAEDVLAAARTLAAKRWPRLADVVDPAKRRKKLADFLHRHGFPFETVQQVVTELARGAVGGEEA
jgi:regulatory protein